MDCSYNLNIIYGCYRLSFFECTGGAKLGIVFWSSNCVEFNKNVNKKQKNSITTWSWQRLSTHAQRTPHVRQKLCFAPAVFIPTFQAYISHLPAFWKTSTISKSGSCNRSDFQRKPLFWFQDGSTERKKKHRYALVHPQCVELPRSSSVVTFLSQSCLPPIATNQFSFEWTTHITDDFVLVRSSHVAKALSKMNIDSGTGPDGLSTVC